MQTLNKSDVGAMLTCYKEKRNGGIGKCKVTVGVIPVSLLGLRMMHPLVVTHLLGCVEVQIIALFRSMHEGD